MTINVTQEHIDSGRKKSPTCCPVALALKDKGFRVLGVGWQTINLGMGPNSNLCRSIKAPAKVSAFIRTFDRVKRNARPFSFTINDLK